MDIKDFLNFLESEINFIFDHEESFSEDLVKIEYEDLINVSFDYACIYITYIVESGRHVSDFVLMIDYLRWRDGIKSNIK